MTDFDTLNAAGLAERGDLLGDTQPEPTIAAPIEAPRLEGQPAFPEPGIYFGMPEETYHAIHAFSASGAKKLAASSMDYWANSVLNPDREESANRFFDYGKAIHAFVLEGEEAYLSRYATDLDLADFADLKPLVSTDEIKQAISRFSEPQPVKPVTGKQAMIDQLAELIAESGVNVPIPDKVDDLKAAIRSFTRPAPVRPVAKVNEPGEDGEDNWRSAVKEDWIDQLLALDPQAKVWDRMVAEHRAKHEGKTMIDAVTDRRIRVAVKMIFAHPELAKAFTGGFPEVSVFYHCPTTGVPVKCRFDYLKMRLLVDLKSFSNKQGMPVDRAVERAIANYRYNIQHSLYEEAVMMARQMVVGAEPDALPIFSCEKDFGGPDVHQQRVSWCEKWAVQPEPPGFLFVFQQSGIAPVTRGKLMPRGTVFSVTNSRVEELKRRWAECAKTYGADPWLDIAPIDTIEDEAIPLHATEI